MAFRWVLWTPPGLSRNKLNKLLKTRLRWRCFPGLASMLHDWLAWLALLKPTGQLPSCRLPCFEMCLPPPPHAHVASYPYRLYFPKALKKEKRIMLKKRHRNFQVAGLYLWVSLPIPFAWSYTPPPTPEPLAHRRFSRRPWCRGRWGSRPPRGISLPSERNADSFGRPPAPNLFRSCILSSPLFLFFSSGPPIEYCTVFFSSFSFLLQLLWNPRWWWSIRSSYYQ